MGLFGVLLFISTNIFIICAGFEEVAFRLIVLKPDLNAIALYFENGDANMEAFIHWPHDIVFPVLKIGFNNEVYLKIDGKFENETEASSYDSLYFRNGQFYLQKIGQMTPMEDDAEVICHKQEKPIEKGESYLSIQYRSFSEVEAAIDLSITKQIIILKSCIKQPRLPFLATWNDPPQQILEYTVWNNDIFLPRADGEVRVLIAEVKNKKVSLINTELFDRVVLNQETRKLGIHVYAQPDRATVENFFGIRMDSVGFLTEVRGDKVKLLSADDLPLSSGTSPSKHSVLLREFLSRSWRAEPQSYDCWDTDHIDEGCLRDGPEMGKFQIHSHVLIKRVNYQNDGEHINQGCPLVIESESEGTNFVFGGTPTKQICTNDHVLWEGTYSKEKVDNYNPKAIVDLMYPE